MKGTEDSRLSMYQASVDDVGLRDSPGVGGGEEEGGGEGVERSRSIRPVVSEIDTKFGEVNVIPGSLRRRDVTSVKRGGGFEVSLTMSV